MNKRNIMLILQMLFVIACLCGCAENVDSGLSEVGNTAKEIIKEENNEPAMVLNKIDDEKVEVTDKKRDEIANDTNKLLDEEVINVDKSHDKEIIDTDESRDAKENNPDNASADGIDNVQTEEKLDFYYEPLSDDIKERITGLSYPSGDCLIKYDDLSYVHVLYVDFNNETKEGELICANSLAKDFVEIFAKLYEAGYQLQEISLVDKYGADDDASCEANNTSAFNYRVVDGSTKLSKHSYGRAIDINPMINPYVTFKTGVPSTKLACSQPYIDRSQEFSHKIDENDLCYKLFKEHGFTWGGDWKNVKDYQHFEK